MPGANRDVIQNFHHSQRGHIDLRGIDADNTRGGNQAFDFIGKAAFGDNAGELRFSNGLLQGDVNGDGRADFEVKVVGLTSMTNSDFLL